MDFGKGAYYEDKAVQHSGSTKTMALPQRAQDI
jgi:hypothetical protein